MNRYERCPASNKCASVYKPQGRTTRKSILYQAEDRTEPKTPPHCCENLGKFHEITFFSFVQFFPTSCTDFALFYTTRGGHVLPAKLYEKDSE